MIVRASTLKLGDVFVSVGTFYQVRAVTDTEIKYSCLTDGRSGKAADIYLNIIGRRSMLLVELQENDKRAEEFLARVSKHRKGVQKMDNGSRDAKIRREPTRCTHSIFEGLQAGNEDRHRVA